ncbi:hypothetical protein P0D69_42220 [Paraburkholderia sediminicola]|uniref:hypothetical protein n=1 Tax=Paraburkholderia TaxID=1822464 RepID=UPI0014561501|nr:hypothetical protein [Paraburkholderia aromaticivorans]
MPKEKRDNDLDLNKLMAPAVFIAAAETEDELGCVLRLHLLVERLLNSYVDAKLRGPLTDFVAEPRTFAT